MRRFQGRLIAGAVVSMVSGATACERQKAADPAARSSSTAAVAAPATPASPAVVPAAQTTGGAPGPRLTVARTPQYGAFLTDASGRSLYLLEEDPPNGSRCTEMCAAIWPPLLAGQGRPAAADSSVRAQALGTIERAGGGSQVTYNGHPLYYYLGDGRPGQTRGQHVEDSWGEWRLVSPAGGGVGERRGGGRRGRDRRGEDDR